MLRNATLDAWEAAGCPPAGTRPGEGDVLAVDGCGEPVRRYDDTTPRADHRGDIQAMPLYAGAGCGAIGDLPAADALVARLMDELRAALAGGAVKTEEGACREERA